MNGTVKKESLLFGLIGLLVGIVIMGFVAGLSVNNNYTAMTKMMGMRSTQTSQGIQATNHMGMSMDSMNASLQGKTGDDFDKLFVSEMIDHHQGAIEMAILAKQNAKHEEINILADDIITAQTKEIIQMKTWQKQWGYETQMDDSHNMMH